MLLKFDRLQRNLLQLPRSICRDDFVVIKKIRLPGHSRESDFVRTPSDKPGGAKLSIVIFDGCLTGRVSRVACCSLLFAVIHIQHFANPDQGPAPFFNPGTDGVKIDPRILAAAPDAPARGAPSGWAPPTVGTAVPVSGRAEVMSEVAVRSRVPCPPQEQVVFCVLFWTSKRVGRRRGARPPDSRS
jgi:hypothetical protein